MMEQRKPIQVLASVAANLGQLTNGFCVSLSSFALPQILRGEGGIQMTLDESSWFASMVALGCVTGALSGGYTCEKFGRKKSMMMDCLGYIIGFLLIGLAPSLPLILLGRFMTGHFAGSNLVCTPIFVGETSHPSIRGLTGSILMILYCSGFTLSMLLGAIFPWRTVTCLATIPPTLSFLLLCIVKESPSWLLRQKSEADAYNSLFFYRGSELVVREELDRMKENIRRLEKQKEAFGSTRVEQIKAKIKRMGEGSFLKPFLLLNLMINVGLEWGGYPALAFYMHTILEHVQVPFDTYWIAVVLSAFRSVVSIICSFILVKAPRRSMYLFAGSITAIALATQAAFAWCNSYIPDEYMAAARWIPFLAIILQYAGFALGYGTLYYNFQGEIFPSDMRSFGSGLLGISNNIVLFLTVKTIPLLMTSIGIGGMFFTYCCFTLLTLTICFFVMPETKGMSLEDIEDYYASMKKPIKTEHKTGEV